MTTERPGNPQDPADQAVRRLLTDAVADVVPGQRLAVIRQRTASPRARRGLRRLVVPATVGLAAATVAAALVLPRLLGEQATDRVVDPSGPTAPVEPGTSAVPIYYVGPAATGPDAPGPVLYRSFEPGAPGGADALDLLTGTPSDPDYRTLWPAGSLRSLSTTATGGLEVGIDPALRERPVGMSGAEARLAVQQVVYTVRAVTQSQAAVLFADGRGGGRVLGLDEPTTGWLPEPPLAVLSHLSISDPTEGAAYDAAAGSFLARGVANSFENTVLCRVLDAAGRSVVDAPTQHEGSWTEEILHPWEVRIDLADVEPGRYTLRCATDDPTGGAEGSGPAVDTRTIDVR